MAYKYLNSARINSTIKKHNIKVAYTKGEPNFHFVDIVTGVQVGDMLQIKRMHDLTIDQWRTLAEQVRTKTSQQEAANIINSIAA